MTARRYLAIVQDPRGYPAPGEPLEAAPPEGPAPPMVHTVVLADAYEALERESTQLRAIVGKVPREQLGQIVAELDGADSQPGVYCRCANDGDDPRSGNPDCVHAAEHAAGLEAADARAAEHSDAQLGGQF